MEVFFFQIDLITPVNKYLYITPDTQELQNVSPLEGRCTFDTEAQLREMIGDDQVKCLAISPAGENRVSLSCICSERYRQLEDGGISSVMGSKNLKSIAIRSWPDVRIADRQRGLHDFDIRFGEAERAITLVHDIAHQKGLVKDAALGSKRLSEKYGKQEYALQVKGQEVPAYDPRGSWGMGIDYVAAPRSGCHMSCFPIDEESRASSILLPLKGKPSWLLKCKRPICQVLYGNL